jgi:hypothetical protein
LCLSIVGAPLQGPLHEGMQFAAAYHTEVAMRLVVLWAVVSSVAQFILGCLPADVFHAEVVGSKSRRSSACILRILARGSTI